MGFVVCGGLLRYGVRRLRFSLLMGFVVSISSHYDVCRLLDLSLYCTFVRWFPNKEGNRRLKIFCFAVLVNQIFFFQGEGTAAAPGGDANYIFMTAAAELRLPLRCGLMIPDIRGIFACAQTPDPSITNVPPPHQHQML